MGTQTDDIESLILDIERADIVANDDALDRDVREDALVQFIKRSATPLIDLLDELKQWRMQSGETTLQGHAQTHRILLEGFSDKTAEAALSSALDKAAHYFTESHDVSITVQQLMELPHGGHRAVIEVHITPFTAKDTTHLKNADIQLKRDHDKTFRMSHHKEEDHAHHLIFEHFSALSNAKVTGHLPPSLIINISDAKILHYMLEKQFLKADMAWKNLERTKEAGQDVNTPQPVLVRFQRTIDQ